MLYWRSNWKPRSTPSGVPRSQYDVCIKKKDWIKPGAICTTWFTARQVENDRRDALAGWWGIWSPWPAEVAERSHGFTGEVVGGKPVIIHYSEGQTGKPVSVLFRTDMAGRHKKTTTTNQSGVCTNKKRESGEIVLTRRRARRTLGAASSVSLVCVDSWP